MHTWPKNPLLYEINTWAWLEQLSQQQGHTVTLATVPQAELERIAAYGFDGVWLMGIWQRSPAGQEVARAIPALQEEYRRALPDCRTEDIVGSPYCILDYRVDAALGGDAELATLRGRLADLGLLLMLDFVPNHLARDHAWTTQHPDWLVQGTTDALAHAPENYFTAADADGQWHVYAHGRDPYLPGWSDTVQVDYRHPAARRAMADYLVALAERCDGARCDMAMLVTRDVFLRTWGGMFDTERAEFWPEVATTLHALHPGFVLLAEVYWNLEWELQQQGFDYTYDKRLYDRLLERDAVDVTMHLTADMDYQNHLARFVENHDERRAVTAFGEQRSLAAALLSYTVPGLRLFHEGQLDGWRVKLPVQLGRRPAEATNPPVQTFYHRLLAALSQPVFHDGQWRLFAPMQEWAGNPTHRHIVAHGWKWHDDMRLIFVNLSPEPAQAVVPLDWPQLAGSNWRLDDILNDASYVRRGDEMIGNGLYIHLPAYGYHLFEVHHA
ncbi:MAG: alpha-amylase family glycosyl hydrolase [Anaerolineae bacterium]